MARNGLLCADVPLRNCSRLQQTPARPSNRSASTVERRTTRYKVLTTVTDSMTPQSLVMLLLFDSRWWRKANLDGLSFTQAEGGRMPHVFENRRENVWGKCMPVSHECTLMNAMQHSSCTLSVPQLAYKCSLPTLWWLGLSLLLVLCAFSGTFYCRDLRYSIRRCIHFQTSSKDTVLPVSLSCRLASIHPWFCSFRLWRFINHLLTYFLTYNVYKLKRKIVLERNRRCG